MANTRLPAPDILLSALASPTSALYRDLMDNNLINNTFDYELFEGPGYCSIIFGGESRAPKQAAEMIKRYIAKIKETGVAEEDFVISRKAVYGDIISSLNSVSTISNTFADYYFNGNELFAYIDAVASVTKEDVEQCLTQMLDVNNCTLSVVKNTEE